MKLNLNIYSIKDYHNYLRNFNSTCFNDHYNGTINIEFYKGLLQLSGYSCFYCGEILTTNNEKGLYFEKEHMINRGYRGDKSINAALNKCKYNLIPICKTCNSLKTHISLTDNMKTDLDTLENKKKCKASRKSKCVDYQNSFSDFVSENFDPFSQDVKFDILHKLYSGEFNYVSQFGLNKRTYSLFKNTVSFLYEVNSSYNNGGFINHLKEFSRNSLEHSFIDYLAKINLINDFGTTHNFNKLNNLFETMTLLEEFE